MEEEKQQMQQKEGVVGPSIGIGIVLIVLVLGGIYYWSSTFSKIQEKKNPVSATSTEQYQITPNQTSTSTEVDDLLKEVNNLDLNSLDQDLNNL